MKTLEMWLDKLIVQFCRFALSLAVSVLALKISSFILDYEFTKGALFGIVFWLTLDWSTKKINLKNK